MKKYIILLLFCAFAITSNAQTIKSIGLKIGRTTSNQSWDYYYAPNFNRKNIRDGYYAAISMDILSKKHISFIADLSYCQKGFTDDMLLTTSSNLQGDGTYLRHGARVDYMSFNPMFKYRKENTHFIPYFIIGPRIDYEIGLHPDDNNYWLSNDFKKTVFGLTGGIGLEYKFKYFGVHLEYQYQHDFTNIINKPLFLKVKNSAAVANFGFKYYLNN